MPPKMAENAAKYATKTHQKSQKTADLDQQQPYFIFVSKLWELFWRKNPSGPFQFGICFENQFQNQRDFY